MVPITKQANFDNQIQSAEIVLGCSELNQTLEFYNQILGLVIESIYPADEPKVAVLSGYGIRLRLEIGTSADTGTLRLLCTNPSQIFAGQLQFQAPNGTTIELIEALPEIILPPEKQSFVLCQLQQDSDWGLGRAGMQYRDLIPNRQGGRFIASHIRIPEGGPVPDYVHFHRVRFQLIFCYKGWVKVVYEDQGEPFILKAGDCVLQPPTIRHRVLESSAGLEVVEVGCPALHETFADREMALPNNSINPDREFFGQKFVRHIATTAKWKPWRIAGFESRDTGIGKATAGLTGVYVIRSTDFLSTEMQSHSEEFLFLFTLRGYMDLSCEKQPLYKLNAGDSVVIPKNMKHAITAVSNDLEFLEVRMSDKFKAS